jgi:CRISPR-associated protein Csd2
MTLMFDHDRSATRGEMALRGLYVFSHDDPLGRAPAHRLFELVTVTRLTEGPARGFGDYKVEVDEAAMPDGVTLTRLVG